MSRDTLNDIILGTTKLTDAVNSGDVKLTGDKAKLDEFISFLDNLNFWFNIVTPRQV